MNSLTDEEFHDLEMIIIQPKPDVGIDEEETDEFIRKCNLIKTWCT